MSRISANILAIGWLLVLLGFTGIGLTFAINDANIGFNSTFTGGNCPLAETYYKRSDLTRAEKKQFSTNAVAFDLLGASKQRYRLVIDYLISDQLRDNVEVRSYLSSVSDIPKLKFKYLINGVESEEEKQETDGKNNFLSIQTIPLNSNASSVGIIISTERACEFSSNELIWINKDEEYGRIFTNWRNSSGILSNFQSEKLELKPGENFVAFEDWSYLGNIIESGVKISSFSAKLGEWIPLDKKSLLASPGKAYLIDNPSKSTVTIFQPPPFRVPDNIDTTIIEPGWNLISVNFPNTKLKDAKVSINSDPTSFISKEVFSLEDLVKNGLMTQLNPLEKGRSVSSDINGVLESRATGKFWVKLDKEPKNNLKIPNIILSVEGLGDNYATHQIPFKVILENRDSLPQQIISSTQTDPCQIGIIVKDTKGGVVYNDYSKRVCPLWPNLEDLSVGEKKEYNYLWEAPVKLTGNYIVEVYFNYSRLGGHSLIKTTSITLK